MKAFKARCLEIIITAILCLAPFTDFYPSTGAAYDATPAERQEGNGPPCNVSLSTPKPLKWSPSFSFPKIQFVHAFLITPLPSVKLHDTL